MTTENKSYNVIYLNSLWRYADLRCLTLPCALPPTEFSSNYFVNQFSDEPETVYVDIIIYCESCAFGNLSIFVGLISRYTLRYTSNQFNIFSTTNSLYYRLPGFSWFSPDVDTAVQLTPRSQIRWKILKVLFHYIPSRLRVN